MPKDTILYDRLGLPPHATESEIKREGSKLSRKWHPDKNIENTEEASIKFKEIREAMEILLDTEKRSLYDQIGMDILDIFNTQSQPQNPFEPFSFFSRQHSTRVEPIVKIVEVHLEQIYNEDSIPITYDRLVKCSFCLERKMVCTECNGQKMKIEMMRMGPMVQQRMVPCQKCRGKGSISQCVHCHGTCETTQSTQIQLKLKKMLVEGMALTLHGKGHMNEEIPGDLIVKIREKQHPIFTRYRKNHLMMTLSLNLYEALFGFSREIRHLDGSLMYLSYSGKTDYDSKKCVVGAGMNYQQRSEPGDLIIRFVFELPYATPEEIESILNKMKPVFVRDPKSIDVSLIDFYDDPNENDKDNESENMNGSYPHPQECRTM